MGSLEVETSYIKAVLRRLVWRMISRTAASKRINTASKHAYTTRNAPVKMIVRVLLVSVTDV